MWQWRESQQFQHQVTWLDDEDNKTLDLAKLDIGNMCNHGNRIVVNSGAIYQQKKKNIKMVGKYVVGDVFNENNFLISTTTFNIFLQLYRRTGYDLSTAF